MKLPRIQDQSSLYDGNSSYEAAAIVYTQDQSTFLVPLLQRMKKDMRVVCGWFQGRHKMWPHCEDSWGPERNTSSSLFLCLLGLA